MECKGVMRKPPRGLDPFFHRMICNEPCPVLSGLHYRAAAHDAWLPRHNGAREPRGLCRASTDNRSDEIKPGFFVVTGMRRFRCLGRYSSVVAGSN